ncbi:hypothetical protein BJ546DRAFT_228509 [Cryomyces antarcticus]|nr:hypothetical protein LTR04_005005 [Oleoguttula sp. CCFEE 6159]
MAGRAPFGYRRPSPSTIDRKRPSFFDVDDDCAVLDDAVLDTANGIMSPAATHYRRDSFPDSNTVLSPAPGNWDDFGPAFDQNDVDCKPQVSANPIFGQNKNPFARLQASQAAPYGQLPVSWTFEEDPGTCTPTTATFEGYPVEYETGAPAYLSAEHFGLPTSGYHGIPFNNVRSSSVFPPVPQIKPPISPSSNNDWMSLAEQEIDARPTSKRVRLSGSSRSFSPGAYPRGDGIRKKNARFDIPSERNLENIDRLIAESNNDEEVKELKQQKRLLRNRQAALDSRQRKKKHTENLEEEKKTFTDKMCRLEDEVAQLQLQASAHMQEKEHFRQQHLADKNIINELLSEKEELVRNHTRETGELRKQVNMLKECAAPVMSAAPSSTGFTDFNSDLDGLHMGGTDWESYIMVNDFTSDFAMEPEQGPPSQQQQTHDSCSTLVVSPTKKLPPTETDTPVASGLLLMLLLCGAFVASKSAGSTAPVIPRMPDDVRAASATVLSSIFQDAGVAPAPQHADSSANRGSSTDALEPTPSATNWPQPSVDLATTGRPSRLDQLHHRLTAPTKAQEAEQLFGLSAQQYNSLTTMDHKPFPYSHNHNEDPTAPPPHRRNLAEALAAVRDDSRGGAADVYTRSLLWDRIPSEVVRDFKRLVEESAALEAAKGNEEDEPVLGYRIEL